MLNTVLGIMVVIGGIILLHELGHFIAARLVGIRVLQFSIGFPPKLFSKKIGETEYRISLIPLGGYVKMAGMLDESLDKGGIKGEPWEFESKKTYQKALAISGGVLMNFLSAAIIFILLVFFSGVPEIIDKPVPKLVVDGYPAAAAGIEPGDTILAINQQQINSWTDMTRIIQDFPGKPIVLIWKHGTEVKSDTLVPVAEKVFQDGEFREVGRIGIGADYIVRSAGVLTAITVGLKQTWRWVEITYYSIKLIVTGKESFRNIGGPITIAKMAGQSASQGWLSLLNFFAIISINLALLNLIPLLPLDGGHLAIILFERISGRSIPVKIRMALQTAGMILFLILMVFVLRNDLLR